MTLCCFSAAVLLPVLLQMDPTFPVPGLSVEAGLRLFLSLIFVSVVSNLL